MLEQQIPPCEICGKDIVDCKCPVCPVCGIIGDLACVDNHYKITIRGYATPFGVLKWEEIVTLKPTI